MKKKCFVLLLICVMCITSNVVYAERYADNWLAEAGGVSGTYNVIAECSGSKDVYGYAHWDAYQGMVHLSYETFTYLGTVVGLVSAEFVQTEQVMTECSISHTANGYNVHSVEFMFYANGVFSRKKTVTGG